jgi:hypothetical protein
MGRYSAEIEKVNEVLKIMPLDHLGMAAGDTVFFIAKRYTLQPPICQTSLAGLLFKVYKLASNKTCKDIHASSHTPISSFTGDLLTEEATSITENAEFIEK